jgi:hypothetical protein
MGLRNSIAFSLLLGKEFPLERRGRPRTLKDGGNLLQGGLKGSQQMKKNIAYAFILPLLIVLRTWSNEVPVSGSTFGDEILRHVRYLASDELTGRGVDTPGIDKARDYIAHEFKKYGLLPLDESGAYLQGLNVVTGVKVTEPTILTLGNGSPLALDKEWVPLGLSGSGVVKGEGVFVGYGITAKDYGYDDYAGVDVRGKIALVLRYEPPPKSEKSPFQKRPRSSHHATLRAKVTNAREHGASAVILVDLNPPRAGEKDLILMARSSERGVATLVAVQVKRQIMEKWFQEAGASLSELKEKIDREEKPASLPLPSLKVSAHVILEQITKKTDNVIGILPGSDPHLKEETIVIGAHYDHLGFGYFGTRDFSTQGEIHNGADDNGSGTAVLLTLAQRLSRLPERPMRTVVFAAFTGEELGLYGSRHFVAHPPFPITSTKAMVNLDMVGRMTDNRVTVSGIDSAKELRGWVTDAGQQLGVEIRPSTGRIGRSDHAPFYEKNIPVLHFYTGSHDDYHRPTDDWEKLNIEGMVRIGDLVLSVVKKIASAKEPPSFVRVPSPAARAGAGEG